MMRKYFLRANTSSGCVSFFGDNLKDMKIIAVGGKSKKAKSRLLEAAAAELEGNGFECEAAVSPFNIGFYDAVLSRGAALAVVDNGFLYENVEFNTDDVLNMDKADEEYAAELLKKRDNALNNLYGEYEKAKKIHDEWESIYISNMDFERLNSFAESTIERLIQKESQNGKKAQYERFFGASTPDGSVNYIDNLTEGLERRYFIKGRPGTGKSTFLKRLAKAAQERGYDAEIYYCSFDRNSLDMVLLPELKFCVFDSTAPHEFFPSRSGDSILDFYNESGLVGTDEKYGLRLDDIKSRYNFRVGEGRSNLRLACGYEDEAEYYYMKAADENALLDMGRALAEKIKKSVR